MRATVSVRCIWDQILSLYPEGWKFLKFDINSFYPSITKELLKQAIDWARGFYPITAEDEELIFHVRKSFLFSQGPWKKSRDKDEENSFDVTMGSWDGAECCEIVGFTSCTT